MNTKPIASQVASTVLFTIVLLIALALVRVLSYYVIYSWLVPLFNWFNTLSLLVKILIFFFGGTFVVVLITGTAKLAAMAMRMLMFKYFGINTAMVVISWALSFLNFITLDIGVWRNMNYLGFWGIVEGLMITAFLFNISIIFIVAKPNYE